MGEQIFQKVRDTPRLSDAPLLVFAADPDCGGGLRCFGTNAVGKPRTRLQFLKLCREIVQDGAVDGVLLSPANAALFAVDADYFHAYAAQPMVRFNAESAVWVPRGGKYRETFSQPFTTVSLSDDRLNDKVKLGLYSITLNNDAESDWLALAAYLDFAREIGASMSWSHCLEVFPPQTEAQSEPMSLAESGEFVADSIVRLISHLPRHLQPLFIKTTFTTPQLWRELCDFDSKIIVGALGGPRMGTLETLQLAQNVVENGGRAVLFGRTLFEDPQPRLLCQVLREVLDRNLDAKAAFKRYTKEIKIPG